MSVRDEILTHLEVIETRESARVLYACESGSRAWGFPSADSDYDVRFIYLHPRDWYLAIDLERKRDVIESPITDHLDVSGWDLRKALQLLRKFNPPLMEWLGSPIVYREETTVAARMRNLLATYYSPTACLYHYLHMAQGNYRDYLKGPIVWVKKYFYVLRPLLAIRWIERDLGVVPTPFQTLVEGSIDDTDLKQAIDQLVEDKRQGNELDRGPRIDLISAFVENELARLESQRFERIHDPPNAPIDDFNALFRTALDEVWGQACLESSL
jgi:uncharacterized protein